MDILSPVAAAVIALFELTYQEEKAYFEDYDPPAADPWALDRDLRYCHLDTNRHIRHQDSVQGIDMDRQTTLILVRGLPPRCGAEPAWHLIPHRILF